MDLPGTIFIHVPKTGGQTVVRLLREKGVHIRGWHTPATWFQRRFGEDVFKKVPSIAFVRNPLDRLVSAYFYGVAVSTDPSKQESTVDMLRRDCGFKAFVRWLYDNPVERHRLVVTRPQAWFVRGLSGDVPPRLVPYDNFENGVREFFRKHLSPVASVPTVNTSLHSHFMDYHDEETVAMTLEMYADDFELHESLTAYPGQNVFQERPLDADAVNRLLSLCRMDNGKHRMKNRCSGLLEMIRCLPTHNMRMVEIGSHLGISTAMFANYFSDVIAVDPWRPWPPWGDRKALASSRLSAYSNVHMLQAFSMDAAAQTKDGTIDFVYIDGDHSFAGASSDIAVWHPKVVDGGYIGGHDYEKMNGVMLAVDDFVKAGRLGPVRVFPDTSWLATVLR